jgi:hypothetical protein
MKKYRAMVRVSGIWVSTIVFADTANHALLLMQAQFGKANAPNLPSAAE